MLDIVDATLAVVVCALPVFPVLLGPALPIQAYTMLLIITNVLVARALFVPSSPRRTFLVCLAACAPSLPAAYVYQLRTPLPPEGSGVPLFVVEVALWCACTVATSTLASTVIFGLRQKIREARQLGQYTLEEKLGEGGMGVVYRARHAMLRRPTAVKLLPLEKAGEHSIRRFEREVQLTAQLSHPNTVSIYDYGRTPDGIFYYAMEYLDGINLEALVREFGPQPPARVAHLLRQVAGALAEAHGVGLIHRDVKPANIVLCRRGGAPDVAKVVDFGLVKAVGGVHDPALTGLNQITGTPLYLAPEVITGSKSVDARSDLYALGAVGYYLLTGHNVFDGASLIEVCSHHLHTTPVPPSQRLGQALPPGLEALILACLEKKPEKRPESAQKLAAALLACDDVPAWGDDEAHEWWMRHRERRYHPGTVAGRDDHPTPTMDVDLSGRVAPAAQPKGAP